MEVVVDGAGGGLGQHLLQLEEVLPKPAARAVYDHFHPENMPKENTP